MDHTFLSKEQIADIERRYINLQAVIKDMETLLKEVKAYRNQHQAKARQPESEPEFALASDSGTDNNAFWGELPPVLNPEDIQRLLGIGINQTYELLNQIPPPFHFVRVGRLFKVSKDTFRSWLQGQ
jgi:hypothetical protein